MTFQLYKPMIGGKSTTERISFSPTGRIGISQLCYDRYLTGSRYAELYYDKENNKVAIKPLKDKTGNTVTISQPSNRQAPTITGSGFFIFNNLEFKLLQRYTPVWDKSMDMLIIDLDNPI